MYVPLHQIKNKKMMEKNLAQAIKTLRNRKSYSQEELSAKSGLSLRTIQRIENGETEPRGDSLRKLAAAFDMSLDEINDLIMDEDKGFLISLNLSALSFLIFPPTGIVLPLIIWFSKKGKVKGLNSLAKKMLNFQITWNIALFLIIVYIFLYGLFKQMGILNDGYVSVSYFYTMAISTSLITAVLYVYNLALIIANSIRINKGKTAFYFPSIPFLKK
jgi:transcriptional regulator with XRE-family HTH domain